jgi:ankyrin repeat protein
MKAQETDRPVIEGDLIDLSDSQTINLAQPHQPSKDLEYLVLPQPKVHPSVSSKPLVSYGANDLKSLGILAVRQGSLSVKLPVEKAANIAATKENGYTSLYSVANNGHINVVKLLLEKGADVAVASQNGYTSLNAAACNGHIDVVKLLLEKGVDLTITSQTGWTPLNSAASNGHIDVVKLLLENGADLTVAS